MTSPSIWMALRPEIFGKPDEHITLNYCANALTDSGPISKLHDLWVIAKHADNWVPTEIEINGYGNWKGFDNYFYVVALVNKFKNPVLWDYTRVSNPHITLAKSSTPVPNPVFYGNEFEPYIAEHLYFGKKGTDGTDWFRVDDTSTVGFNRFRDWANSNVRTR